MDNFKLLAVAAAIMTLILGANTLLAPAAIIADSGYIDVFAQGHELDENYLLGTLTAEMRLDADTYRLYETNVGFSPFYGDMIVPYSIDVLVITEVLWERNNVNIGVFESVHINFISVQNPVGDESEYTSTPVNFDWVDGDIIDITYRIKAAQISYTLEPDMDDEKTFTPGYELSTYSYTYYKEAVNQTNETEPTEWGKYSGQVNNAGGIGINDAYVEIGDLNTHTDSTGVWSIDKIPVGDYALTVTKTGYVTQEKDITVTDGSDRTYTMTLVATSSVPITDADEDGMDDAWEIQHFGDLTQAASGDYDSDGLTNIQEYVSGSNPTVPDEPDDYVWTDYGYMAVLGGIIGAAVIFAVVPLPPKIKGFMAIAVALAGLVIAHLLNTGVI